MTAAAHPHTRCDPHDADVACACRCLPQKQKLKKGWAEGKKTDSEKTEFDWMLNNAHLLYLGSSVLILLDLSYLSRFWWA